MSKKFLAAKQHGSVQVAAWLTYPLIILGLSLILSSSSFAREADASSSSPLNKKADKLSQKADKTASRAAERSEKIASKASERREKLEARAATQIKELGERMLSRMQAAIKRLTNILGRIESRIAKIEARNKKDTAPLKTKITKVKTQLQAAQTSLDQARSELAAIDTSDKPGEVANQVKSLTARVRDTLKQAHKDMVDLVIAIAKLEPKEPKAATVSSAPASSSAEEQ